MPKYHNGKIYCIKSNQTNMIYIGSTTTTLSKRFYNHKWKFLNNDECLSRDIMKYDDAIIELLEKVNCNSKQELLDKEKEYILKNKNIIVNYQIPNNDKKISIKEWKLKNKDYIKEYNLEYYKNNKYHCINCNKEFTVTYKARHNKICI
jgi:hypothetical protein